MKLHVSELGPGSGPAIVVLHGCPVPPGYLSPICDALSERHRVLRIFLPGYGASPALPEPYSLEAARVWIEDALLDRGLREVAIVGHSLGAYRAFQIALGGRIRVSRLACLGGMADLGEERRKQYLELAPAIRTGADLRDLLPAVMLSPTFLADHPETVAELRAWWDLLPLTVVAAEIEAIAGMPSLLPQLKDVELELLLRHGTDDAAIPSAHAEEIKRRFDHPGRQARLQLVPGVGHSPMHEDRAGTEEALRTFFDEGV